MLLQTSICLAPKARGFHLITEEVLAQLPQLASIEVGLAHFFLKHTSASLSLNENADTTVRSDLENFLDRLVPESSSYFQHTYEGADDMPAHIKAALLGCQLSIPIQAGRLQLGTWQGMYLGEHRNNGGSREIVVSLQAMTASSNPLPNSNTASPQLGSE